jgi:hypothetical protein
VQRYGNTLKTVKELPDFVLEILPPDDLTPLAADVSDENVHELEGDLQALRLVDLDAEGLSEYKPQLQRRGISYIGAAAVEAVMAAEEAKSKSVVSRSQVSLAGSSNV